MTGASINHNTIAGNIFRQLSGLLEGQPSRVFFADLRLRIEAADLFTYPDVFVICGDVELYGDRRDTVLNPRMIVEVLSPSTKDYDRGSKFELYRAIPGFEEYVTVDQDRVKIEQFVKNSDGNWVLSEFEERDAGFRLESLDVTLRFADIYRNAKP